MTTQSGRPCAMCEGTRGSAPITITLTRGDATIVIRGVPGEACDICGDEYLAADVARELEAIATTASQAASDSKFGTTSHRRSDP